MTPGKFSNAIRQARRGCRVGDAGWVAESTSDAGPAPSTEVTQLHGNGSGADAARTPPAN